MAFQPDADIDAFEIDPIPLGKGGFGTVWRATHVHWPKSVPTDIKARMELMRHKTPTMKLRYSHLSVEYKRQAIAELPSFAEASSQQISQQTETPKVVAFGP